MPTKITTCSIDGCKNVGPVVRGLCQKHYTQWKRQSPPATVCTVDDCGRRHEAKGYCSLHYARWKDYGDPLYEKIPLKTAYRAEYTCWQQMKVRCYNPRARNYRNYGGRGITVCERWLNSFKNFLADMGERPEGKYSIDRIDNNGNYEPDNCRWATDSEQNLNRRHLSRLRRN